MNLPFSNEVPKQSRNRKTSTFSYLKHISRSSKISCTSFSYIKTIIKLASTCINNNLSILQAKNQFSPKRKENKTWNFIHKHIKHLNHPLYHSHFNNPLANTQRNKTCHHDTTYNHSHTSQFTFTSILKPKPYNHDFKQQ